MRRGEVWTAAAGKGYAGKPRPVVIIQDDRFAATDSITVCAVTTDPTEAPLLRVPLGADAMNGLRPPSSLMVDKITTMPRSTMGQPIGRLADEDMVALSRAIVDFLGVAGPRCWCRALPVVSLGGLTSLRLCACRAYLEAIGW